MPGVWVNVDVDVELDEFNTANGDKGDDTPPPSALALVPANPAVAGGEVAASICCSRHWIS